MRIRYYLLLCALLLAACSAWAQAPGSYDNPASNACTTNPGVTSSIIVSSGQLVVLWMASNANGDTYTVTDSASQTYSVATGPKSAAGTTHLTGEMFYKQNSAALSSISVTATLGATCWLNVAVYSGMATSGALDVANIRYNSTAGTTCSSPAVTTGNAKDVVIGGCVDPSTVTYTAGITGTCSNTNTLEITTSHSGLQDCNTTATGSFGTNMGISSSVKSIGAIAAFKQAAAVTCPKTLLILGVGC